MCRLLYMPSMVRPPKPALVDWLGQLVKSFGGDGCGLATLKGGCVKGVALTHEQSVELILKTRRGIVWHTRKVSCGAKTDELCHPFDTGRGWLVHNGHWATGAFAARFVKGAWSDSSVAAHSIRLHGWRRFTEDCRSGVWLHLTRHGCAVHYCSGELWVETASGALGSEPCKTWGCWEPVEYGTYAPGEAVSVRKVVRVIELPPYSQLKIWSYQK